MTEIEELEYARAKYLPDMARGFTINTNYGELVIDDDDVAAIIKIVAKTLDRKIATIRRRIKWEEEHPITAADAMAQARLEPEAAPLKEAERNGN